MMKQLENGVCSEEEMVKESWSEKKWR